MNNRPNFLIFCVDQMQAACLGCAGHPDVRTPNLDTLAASGARFERAYCENPLCTPSRLSILTGLSSRQHGVQTLGCLVPHTIPTVASVLHAEGYRTQACGKMHLQPWGLERTRKAEPQKIPPDLYSWEDCDEWMSGRNTRMPEGYFGFEQTDLVCGHADYVGEDYLNWLETEHPHWGRELREHYHNKAWSYYYNENARVPQARIASAYRMEIPPELHYNNWIADRSITWLQGLASDENFFLWCSFPDPHHPFAATKPYSEMYDPAGLTLPATWQEAVANQGLMPDIPTSAHSIQLDDFDEEGLREILAQTYGMITHIDDNVGRVIETLKGTGRYENTIIIFMSDHGDYLGAHHLVCKGHHPFEEILRVPFLWSSPASRSHHAGTVEKGLSSLLDFAPTVLDYAGVPLAALQPQAHFTDHPVDACFNGQSLRHSIDSGEPISAERCLITNRYENRGFASLGWTEPLSIRCFYQNHHKLILSSLPGNDCLFDLADDPGETCNLWTDPAHRDLRNDLLLTYAREALRTDPIGHGRVSGP